MSWFFGSSPAPTSPSSPAQTPDGGFKPMNRAERAKCWEARDTLFSCLDRHQILDAIKEDGKVRDKCARENALYETDCATSWIRYFKQKRVADFDKEQKIRKLEAEGAVPIAETQKPAWKFW